MPCSASDKGQDARSYEEGAVFHGEKTGRQSAFPHCFLEFGGQRRWNLRRRRERREKKGSGRS